MSLLRTATTIASTRVTLIACGAVASVLIARGLGPEGRGEYATVIAIVGTAVVTGHCSVEQAHVFLVSRGASVRALTANALYYGTLVGIAVAAATALVSVVFSFPAGDSLTELALPMSLLVIPLSIVVLWLNSLLTVTGRIKVLNRSMLIAGLAQILILIGLAATGSLSVNAVLVAWLVNAAIPLVITAGAMRPRQGDLDGALASQALRFGLRYHLSLLGLYLLLKIDVLILAAMSDARSVGLYALAVSLIELTNVGTDAISTAVLQRQAQLPIVESGELTARVVALSGILALLAATMLNLFALALVPAVFGDEFGGSLPALLALSPGIVAMAMVRSAGAYLLRRNRPLINSFFTGSCLLVNIVLNLILIPVWGITGCAISSSVGYILLAALYLLWLRRATHLPWTKFRPRLRELLGN